MCRGTLEERIDELINRKREIAKDLLGDDNVESVVQELASLDDGALLDVFRLDVAEAVSNED